MREPLARGAFEQREVEQLLDPGRVLHSVPERGVGQVLPQHRHGLPCRGFAHGCPGAAQCSGPVVDDARRFGRALLGGPERERGPTRRPGDHGRAATPGEFAHRLEGAAVTAAADGPCDAIVEHWLAGLDEVDELRHRRRQPAFADAPHHAAAAHGGQQPPRVGADAGEQDGVAGMGEGSGHGGCGRNDGGALGHIALRDLRRHGALEDGGGGFQRQRRRGMDRLLPLQPVAAGAHMHHVAGSFRQGEQFHGAEAGGACHAGLRADEFF
ncbi:hypothetical protein [Variovorax sp. UC74_104]|uniref:hypothetical protein n=1 Tax=Variovorax sp. UC74_104 TaxID=3374555 RepID=UPI003757D1D8